MRGFAALCMVLVAGSTVVLAAAPSLQLVELQMENAAGSGTLGPKSWGDRAFPSFVLRDGRVIQALICGHGQRCQVNYFEAEVVSTDLKITGDSFSGPVVVKTVKGGDVYLFTFAGVVASDRVSGTFTKTVNGKTAPGGGFKGTIGPVPQPPVDQAIYYLQLAGAVAGSKQLMVFIPRRYAAFGEGIAYAGTWNHSYHDVDAAGLKLEGDRLHGRLRVTMNPDPYVPTDHKPVAAVYEIDARLSDGTIAGTYKGQFGGKVAAGSVLGRLSPIPAVPNPVSISIKLEDGVCDGAPWFRRVCLSFVARDGRAERGSMSNNKDGWRGTFKSASARFEGTRFTATVEGTVDSTRGPKTGRYTFKLEGKVVGNDVVGRCQTLLDGRPQKAGTDFMGRFGLPAANASSE